MVAHNKQKSHLLLPSNKGGILLAWISVIVVKPMSPIAFNVFSHTTSLSDSKFRSLRISKPALEPGTKKITIFQNIFIYAYINFFKPISLEYMKNQFI